MHQGHDPGKGVPFDGVLNDFTDPELELLERVLVAIETQVPPDHPLRGDSIVGPCCKLFDAISGPAAQIAPRLTWDDGEVVAADVSADESDKLFRSSAYATAILIPKAREAVERLLEAGISV
ncbi:MAG: hypothetical protein KDD53_08230 [Bdellovibrionales bacterium]|nr:hypothetical protein [Bdellovibrionales bacterium]